jgi:hypothetical protein
MEHPSLPTKQGTAVGPIWANRSLLSLRAAFTMLVASGAFSTAYAQLDVTPSAISLDGIHIGQSWRLADSLLRQSDSSVRIEVLAQPTNEEVGVIEIVHIVPRRLFGYTDLASPECITYSRLTVHIWSEKILDILCDVVVDSNCTLDGNDDSDALELARSDHLALLRHFRAQAFLMRPLTIESADLSRLSPEVRYSSVAVLRQLDDTRLLIVVGSKYGSLRVQIRISDTTAHARMSADADGRVPRLPSPGLIERPSSSGWPGDMD